MTNQTVSEIQPLKRTPLQPRRVALYHLIIDALMLITILLLVRPIINTEAGINILFSVSSILLSTMIGYFLINRGRSTMGLGFIIFGLIFGFFWLSFIIEGLGGFAFFTLVLVTTITVSTDVSTRLRMYAMSIGVVIGSAAFLIDINTRGASYRVAPPEILNVILWFISAVIIILIGFVFFRQFPFLPFRTKIIASLVILTVISIAILGYLNNNSVRASLIQNANDNLFTAGFRTIDSINAFIDSNLEIIKTEGFIPVFSDYINTPVDIRAESPIRDQALSVLISLRGYDLDYVFVGRTFYLVSSYAILDLEGNILLSSDEVDIGIYEGNMSYFTQALETGLPSFSPNEVAPSTGRNNLYFAAPIKEPLKEIKGVIRVRFEPQILQNVLDTSRDLIGEGSYAVLFKNETLHLVNTTNPEEERFILSAVIPLNDIVYPQLVDEKYPNTPENHTDIELEPIGKILHQGQNNETGFENFSAESVLTGNRENQVVVIDVENTPWVLVFFQPLDVFLKPVGNMANSTIIFGLITASITVGIALSLTNLLAKPITDLTESAKEVSKGNLEVRIDVTTEDELGELSSTFNMMTAQLQNLVTNLEEIIAQRTEVLERRTLHLEAIAEIGRAATEIYNLEELLTTITHLISEKFNFYHVGIFILDARGEFAVLKAANSEGGWRMLARGHKLKVGVQGIVGFVTGSMKPRIQQRVVGDDSVHYDNPDLPLTKSEMAIPLITGGELLGVLDVQSTLEQAFSEEDVSVLQSLADEVAIMINNTRLFEQLQESLETERRIYGELSSEAWMVIQHQSKHDLNIRSDESGVYQVSDSLTPESKQAVQNRRTILADPSPSNQRYLISIPVKIRGNVVVAVLETYKPTASGQWTSQEIGILEAVAEQLGVTLENARLFDETQRLAQKEKIAAEVAGKIWASTDVETILQTAVQELGRALNVSQGAIRLRIPEEGGSDEFSPGDFGAEEA